MNHWRGGGGLAFFTFLEVLSLAEVSSPIHKQRNYTHRDSPLNLLNDRPVSYPKKTKYQ
jgi:hypothetical protein